MWAWVTTAWQWVSTAFRGKGQIQSGSGNRAISGVTVSNNTGHVHFGDVNSPPLPASHPEQAKPLSADAIDILTSAVKTGYLSIMHTSEGHELQCGGIKLLEKCNNSQKVAEMKSALEELLKNGAIEVNRRFSTDDYSYSVTGTGYKLADALKAGN
jgi:hypothetical protein